MVTASEGQAPHGRQSLERVLWRFVLVLLVIGAVLSVWAALGGELSQAQMKMLVSSYGVALFAAMGLGSASVVERMPTSLGARAGLFFALAGGVVLLLGIWLEMAKHMWWWKVFGTTFVMSLATSHASLLLLVNLDARFHRVRTLTRLMSYAFAFITTLMMLFEQDGELFWRATSLTFTLAVFGTLAMPVLAKLSKRA